MKVEYNIKEVANILNISREMIRYYEKKGMISPGRKEENNYRFYDTMDIFFLMEAMQYRGWNIDIKNIKGLKEKQYNTQIVKYLQEYQEQLQKEIEYKQLLIERISQVNERNEMVRYNLGNYWIKKIPERYCFHVVSGQGDKYEKIQLPEEISRVFFAEQNTPFFDTYFNIKKGKELWGIYFEKKYFEKLGQPCMEMMTHLPEEYCLCSNVNLGTIGAFNSHFYEAAFAYMEQKGYRRDGTISALLIGRGVEEGDYNRLVELRIPIKKR